VPSAECRDRPPNNHHLVAYLTMPNSELQLHTKQDLENARTRGQLVGWLQGGGAVLGVFLLLGFIGWLPALLLAGAVGFVAYKILKR
jgi:hypothetical protein